MPSVLTPGSVLTPEELEAVRERIESYFGLPRGEMISADRMEALGNPKPYTSQDSTIAGVVEMVPSLREQVIYDIWRVIQTAKTAY